jgi:hypothetical protein
MSLKRSAESALMNMLGQCPKHQRRHYSLGNDSLMVSRSDAVLPEDQYFIECIVKPIFSQPRFLELPIFQSNWGVWRTAYEAVERLYLNDGVQTEIEFHRPWFVLFIICACNLSLHYKGSFEVQMLIHEAIYRDLHSMFGGVNLQYVKGLSVLMDLISFDDGLYKGMYGNCDAETRKREFMVVCLEAINRISTYNTPIIFDTPLYYCGRRIGLDPLLI